MNAATQKKLLAYAIPIDLVVVATGIGLLVPGIPSVAIVAVYVTAVALSAWKSGWAGAVAAMVVSSGLLFFLFQASVPRDEIGWLIAAGVLASMPLATLHASRVQRRLARATEALLLPEPTIAGPQSIEEAAAEAIRDRHHAGEREARARSDAKRIAAERLAAESERPEERRAELQQQAEREMQPRIDAALARQREDLARDSDRALANVRAAAEERVAAVQAELDRVLAQPAAARPKYEVICVNCRIVFDAADANWCSCLTGDRTVVCTNCLTCFCNSAPAYKEIFWSDAPPQLLERKAVELRRPRAKSS